MVGAARGSTNGSSTPFQNQQNTNENRFHKFFRILGITALIASLTYRVVASKVRAADVKSGMVKTVNGKELTLVVADGTVTADGAKVVTADSNGVIHVIATVVLPK